MKKIIRTICLAVALASALFAFGACAATTEDGYDVVMWSYDAELTDIMIAEFNKIYPDIKVQNVPVDGNAYDQLLQTALFVDEDVPDIIWGDYFKRGKIFSLDILDTLTEAPYDLDTSLISDWVLDLGKDEDGNIVGVEAGPAPTGLLYKRNLTLEYLGTDDPEELSEMFATWESFLTACRKIKEDSGGTVTPFASIGDVYCILVGMTNVPYLVDGMSNVEAVCDAVFERLEVFVDEGLCGRMDQWTAAYFTTYNNDNYVFNICPAWAPDYHIKKNALDQDGNLGICMPPGGKMFSFGGTTWSIYKNARDKEAAWTFLNWCLLTEEGQVNITDAVIANGGSGGVGSLATLYGNADIYGNEDAFFGGQKILDFFVSNMDNVNARPLTKYDTTIGDSLGLVLNSMKNGKSAAECKIQIMDELRLKLPEIFE